MGVSNKFLFRIVLQAVFLEKNLHRKVSREWNRQCTVLCRFGLANAYVSIVLTISQEQNICDEKDRGGVVFFAIGVQR